MPFEMIGTKEGWQIRRKGENKESLTLTEDELFELRDMLRYYLAEDVADKWAEKFKETGDAMAAMARKGQEPR
jgi:hypothetical protein